MTAVDMNIPKTKSPRIKIPKTRDDITTREDLYVFESYQRGIVEGKRLAQQQTLKGVEKALDQAEKQIKIEKRLEQRLIIHLIASGQSLRTISKGTGLTITEVLLLKNYR